MRYISPILQSQLKYMCYKDVGDGVAYKEGLYTYDNHMGTDFMADMGTVIMLPFKVGEVKAIVDGIDDEEFILGSKGNYIRVWEYPDGVVTGRSQDAVEHEFCHIKKGGILVSRGDVISEGTAIGLVGNSGQSANPHVHWTIMSYNPITYYCPFQEQWMYDPMNTIKDFEFSEAIEKINDYEGMNVFQDWEEGTTLHCIFEVQEKVHISGQAQNMIDELNTQFSQIGLDIVVDNYMVFPDSWVTEGESCLLNLNNFKSKSSNYQYNKATYWYGERKDRYHGAYIFLVNINDPQYGGWNVDFLDFFSTLVIDTQLEPNFLGENISRRNAWVMKHEFAHHLGAEHDEVTRSIMYPSVVSSEPHIFSNKSIKEMYDYIVLSEYHNSFESKLTLNGAYNWTTRKGDIENYTFEVSKGKLLSVNVMFTPYENVYLDLEPFLESVNADFYKGEKYLQLNNWYQNAELGLYGYNATVDIYGNICETNPVLVLNM